MKNEKKVGTPVSGSRELKLFEPVAVEFMFQELEFHIPHAQTSSYHIYERDSAGDEDLHLRSSGGPVPINKYVLIRDRVKPVFYIGCPFPGHPVVEGKTECPFELTGGEFVDLEFESLIVCIINIRILLQILR